MSFTRGFEVLLHKSNDYITKITLDDGIIVFNFNSDCQLVSKKQLLFGDYTFLDIYFDINDKDNLYGIINDKKNSLIYVHITEKVIIKSNLIKHNDERFTIKLPYIKSVKNKVSIIYYLLDKWNPYKAILVNHYKRDGQWVKHEIDVINYKILTDFNVIYNEKNLKVFYFKVVNGCTELFVCDFSFETEIWTESIQITNSGKTKVYLSVIRASDNKYHITYSENNMDQYNCKYIKVSLYGDKVSIYKELTISKTIACTFPSIAEYNNSIDIQWSEYQNLYTSFSKTYGKTWSEPNIVKASLNYNFLRCNYKSNYAGEGNVNVRTIFVKENSLDIFNFIKKQVD